MLFDAHLHVQDLSDEQLQAVVALDDFFFLSCSTSLDNFKKLQSIKADIRNVIGFLGIHPWFVSEQSLARFDELEKILIEKEIGVGEIGLDKAAKNIDFKLQKIVFTKQLDLAYKYKRPVVLHCVKAWGSLLELMKINPISANQCMIHGFDGSVEILKQLIDRDFYISVNLSKVVAKQAKFIEIIDLIPDNRLMLESDYPYQFKSTDYSSEFRNLYRLTADILKLSVSELENRIAYNVKNFTKNIS